MGDKTDSHTPTAPTVEEVEKAVHDAVRANVSGPTTYEAVIALNAAYAAIRSVFASNERGGGAAGAAGGGCKGGVAGDHVSPALGEPSGTGDAEGSQHSQWLNVTLDAMQAARRELAKLEPLTMDQAEAYGLLGWALRNVARPATAGPQLAGDAELVARIDSTLRRHVADREWQLLRDLRARLAQPAARREET